MRKVKNSGAFERDDADEMTRLTEEPVKHSSKFAIYFFVGLRIRKRVSDAFTSGRISKLTCSLS